MNEPRLVRRLAASDVEPAVVALERRGIDAGRISVETAEPTSRASTGDIDGRAVGNFEWQLTAKVPIAAVSAGLLALVIALALDAQAGALLAAVIGATVAGALAGGFLLAASALPVNQEAIAASGSRPGAVATIEVRPSSADEAETVREVLSDYSEVV